MSLFSCQDGSKGGWYKHKVDTDAFLEQLREKMVSLLVLVKIFKHVHIEQEREVGTAYVKISQYKTLPI
jgi:hypothetical protein